MCSSGGCARGRARSASSGSNPAICMLAGNMGTPRWGRAIVAGCGFGLAGCRCLTGLRCSIQSPCWWLGRRGRGLGSGSPGTPGTIPGARTRRPCRVTPRRPGTQGPTPPLQRQWRPKGPPELAMAAARDTELRVRHGPGRPRADDLPLEGVGAAGLPARGVTRHGRRVRAQDGSQRPRAGSPAAPAPGLRRSRARRRQLVAINVTRHRRSRIIAALCPPPLRTSKTWPSSFTDEPRRQDRASEARHPARHLLSFFPGAKIGVLA